MSPDKLTIKYSHAKVIINYSDGHEMVNFISLASARLMIDKDTLKELGVNTTAITNIGIIIKCQNVSATIDNSKLNIKHFRIQSYQNYRSSLCSLKLYHIPKIHINGLDVSHIETEASSPIIIRCHIDELFSGCEIMRYLKDNEEEYNIDIRRDTKINKFSGKGKFDINIQESELKELTLRNQIMTRVNKLHIWNGSTVNILKLSVPTEYFGIKNSSVKNLTIGKSHIKKLELENEIVEKCSITDESIDSFSIGRWILEKKSASQKGDRTHYINASYMINKIYSELEKKCFRKFLLKLFSIICGYGYKPLRTIFMSISIILFFGILYGVIEVFYPGSFSNANGMESNIRTLADYLYFSATTYTTTGYVDMVPTNELIKMLSILETITGVSMLSLFIFSLTKTLTEHTGN